MQLLGVRWQFSDSEDGIFMSLSCIALFNLFFIRFEKRLEWATMPNKLFSTIPLFQFAQHFQLNEQRPSLKTPLKKCAARIKSECEGICEMICIGQHPTELKRTKKIGLSCFKNNEFYNWLLKKYVHRLQSRHQTSHKMILLSFIVYHLLLWKWKRVQWKPLNNFIIVKLQLKMRRSSFKINL